MIDGSSRYPLLVPITRFCNASPERNGSALLTRSTSPASSTAQKIVQTRPAPARSARGRACGTRGRSKASTSACGSVPVVGAGDTLSFSGRPGKRAAGSPNCPGPDPRARCHPSGHASAASKARRAALDIPVERRTFDLRLLRNDREVRGPHVCERAEVVLLCSDEKPAPPEIDALAVLGAGLVDLQLEL